MCRNETSESASHDATSLRGKNRRVDDGRGRAVGLVAMAGLVAGLAACQPECEPIDALFAQGFGRPELPPDDAELVWRGGNGGLSVRSNLADAEFDPLLGHLFASTSTAVGTVRWSLVLGLDRVLVVEHEAPLTLGATIAVDTVLADLAFTGGQGSRTFWDDAWRWTAGSTTAARAVLTDAFATQLTAISARGALEVRQVAPVELRVGLSFTDAEGATEVYWSDVAFDADFGIDPCQ
jgi:hypothetical protein